MAKSHETLATSAQETPRPLAPALIITGARIHTTPEKTAQTDLQVADRQITPYEISQDSAHLINANGASVVPLLVDTGFWAFGQYHRGVLHHSGYVLGLNASA